jgi:hypothetical protein
MKSGLPWPFHGNPGDVSPTTTSSRAWWNRQPFPQQSDSRQKPLAMPQRRDTQRAKVIHRQRRQQIRIDVIVAEHLLVLPQAQAG